ncbi:MAG TPA: heme lyase CcmF/NrfE family subunit, partial [Nordella sp.]|nr:heme lyase CcmF/NrfE family subunit [Nordella sp.]
SASFAYAAAALMVGEAGWARAARPFMLLAWIALTCGIALGSWWAYYELGWGGFWFWDPVENASFMPWLVAAALLHSAVVVEKRNALKIWTILLAILAFSLSLVGAFLVRSGVLTSVHAFAVDPARGVFILLILCTFIGGALALFAWRAPTLKAGGLFAPLSREGGLVVNNLLLCTACASVFIGTLYPLALETLTGEKISVGPPYFNLTFGLIMLPLLLLVPVGPLLTWKRAEAWPVIQRLWFAALLTFAAVIVLLVVMRRGPWLAPFGVGLGLWLVLGALVELTERIALFRSPLANSWSRFKGLPRSSLGMTLAHAGVGLAIIGIFAVTTWREEHIVAMKSGDKLNVGGYELTYLGEAPMTGPNYTGDAGRFRVMDGNREVTTLVSERRRFRPGNQETTEVGLLQAWSGDLYAVMGDRMTDGARAMRIYFNPLISLIWIGTFIMFLGGFVSLTDRRFRVGAPKTARKLQPVPAE